MCSPGVRRISHFPDPDFWPACVSIFWGAIIAPHGPPIQQSLAIATSERVSPRLACLLEIPSN